MKAALYYSNSDVRIIEMEKPRIGPDDILVKVKACGICGSDVMEWYRIKSAPRILGHEMVGEIADVGGNVERYNIGQRVFVSHHVPCNTCHYCLKDHQSVCDTLRSTNYFPGGFSEYVKVPPINVDRGVFPLPKEISYDEGVFIEPLACVVRGQRLSNVTPGDSVLIVGSGVTGILHAKYAKATGVGKVITTDINDYKLEMAKKMGADYTINARGDVKRTVNEITGGLGADVVLVTAPSPSAMKSAFDSIGRGGTVLLFAPLKPDERLQLNVWELWRNEITITTSYAGSPRDIERAIEMIRSGRVKVKGMITHRLPLKEAKKGFEIASRSERSLKVVIYP